MKQADPALIALLNSGNEYHMADLYEIAMPNGTVLRYTSIDFDITLGDKTFVCYGPKFTRGSIRESIGLDVDSLNVTITAASDCVLPNGVPIISGFRLGLFDNARLTLYKFFMSNWDDRSIPPVVRFSGNIVVDSADELKAEIMVHSDTERLNIKFPEEVFMPGCSNRIYSAGCGLNRANFESNSTVEAGSTQIILKCLLGQSEGYFDIGFVEFTTGANSSIKRMVKSYSAGQVILTNPLPVVPQVGDQFKIYPGCDGTMATCKNRFNNLSRFKGYPFAPKPESTL